MKLIKLFLFSLALPFTSVLFAESPPAIDGHDAFIKGLRAVSYTHLTLPTSDLV